MSQMDKNVWKCSQNFISIDIVRGPQLSDRTERGYLVKHTIADYD